MGNLEPLINGSISGVVGIATDITNQFYTSTMLQRLAQATVAVVPDRIAEIVGRSLQAKGIEVYEREKRIAIWGDTGSQADVLSIGGKTVILHETPPLLPYAKSVIAHMLGGIHAG